MALDKPKIVVVGSGAMGSLFGGLLAAGGLDVTLVDVWKEHVDTINRAGLRIVGHGGERTIRVPATCDPQSLRAADVVLFQCKAFANEAAARSVRHLVTGSTVGISFQNGLGNEETLGRILGERHVLGGLTAQGAIVVLLGNPALGAVSAATDMTSAQMVAIPELRTVILRALDETAAVARACGVALTDDEKHAIFDKLTRVDGGGTGASKSSMAADIALKRRTEIDTIHGSVARLGRENGVPTPTIDMMIAVVKALESKYAA